MSEAHRAWFKHQQMAQRWHEQRRQLKRRNLGASDVAMLCAIEAEAEARRFASLFITAMGRAANDPER